LSECVTQDRLDCGTIYPDQSMLRDVSRRIAGAVMRESRRQNLGRLIPNESIDRVIGQFMWQPDYSSNMEGG
jgi:malic enzyme